MRILAIESSCDESAAAVYDGEQGLLSHALFSQIELHRLYGGVVPELDSRDQIQRLLPLIDEALESAKTSASAIEGIAYTAGPGLIGALLCGSALARSLATAWRVPSLGIHHLEGHLLAPQLEPEPAPYPHVALLVSGGHTLLIEVKGLGRYRILGETRDDAAGEAFDKSAKLLGLPYPGGPQLAGLAQHGRLRRYSFPRPMLDRPGLEFSFSGLKTAVRQAAAAVEALPAEHRPQHRADIALELQEAVVETLVRKSLRALEATDLQTLVVSGGVSANLSLRVQMAKAAQQRGVRVYYPRQEFCTDNAAMIAVAGHARLSAGERDVSAMGARARWSLESLGVPTAT
jgi:N6-L-threonylcarbamoyladenine synthase